MTNAQTLASDRPLARKRDADATRAAILAAAKTHFARSGYEGGYLRDIAADAGVDAALINRYFGGKDGLFAAALKDSIRPDAISQWERQTFGRDIAKMMANHAHHDNDRMHAFQFLLRAATSPATSRHAAETETRACGRCRDAHGSPSSWRCRAQTSGVPIAKSHRGGSNPSAQPRRARPCRRNSD